MSLSPAETKTSLARAPGKPAQDPPARPHKNSPRAPAGDPSPPPPPSCSPLGTPVSPTPPSPPVFFPRRGPPTPPPLSFRRVSKFVFGPPFFFWEKGRKIPLKRGF